MQQSIVKFIALSYRHCSVSEQCLYDRAINFTIDCCIWLVVLFE